MSKFSPCSTLFIGKYKCSICLPTLYIKFKAFPPPSIYKKSVRYLLLHRHVSLHVNEHESMVDRQMKITTHNYVKKIHFVSFQMIFLQHVKFPSNDESVLVPDLSTSENSPKLPAILPRSGMGFFLIDLFKVNIKIFVTIFLHVLSSNAIVFHNHDNNPK